MFSNFSIFSIRRRYSSSSGTITTPIRWKPVKNRCRFTWISLVVFTWSITKFLRRWAAISVNFCKQTFTLNIVPSFRSLICGNFPSIFNKKHWKNWKIHFFLTNRHLIQHGFDVDQLKISCWILLNIFIRPCGLPWASQTRNKHNLTVGFFSNRLSRTNSFF